jgi:valyl-tRNA synthetase
MSKSKGNVIDPLDYVEKYGADSLRMALIMGAPAGNDQNFNEPRLVGCRNFGNKVWNMARFIEFSKPEDFDFTKFANFNISESNYEDLKKIDSEIVSRHLEFLKNVRNSFEHFKFNEGAEEIYQYVWHEIADNLIEKAKNNKDLYPLLYFIFRDSLLVLHPIMPFITEKIWQSLYSKEKSTSISDTTWPGLEI